MKNFNYKNPTEIIFGVGRVKEIGERLKPLAKKVLLTYGGGGSIKKNGVFDTVIESLQANGIELVEFSGIRPNPYLSHTKEGIALAKSEKVDAILAVGGGSVLDESKAIALGACYDGDVWEFFTGEATPKDALPIFTVLTVPATGSEMNGGMVVTNEATQDKFGFGTPFGFPVLSILDPATTLSLPTSYVACAAVDIFSHATEAYFTKEDASSSVIDRMVEGVLKSLIESTNKVIADPSDINARANFMWTATLAWNGALHCGVGGFAMPCHIIEHPISALYDIAHGAGLAIVLPAWMNVFEQKYQSRFALLAKNVFDIAEQDEQKAAQKGREAMTKWFKSLGLAVTFAEAGIETPDIEKLSHLAMNVMGSKGKPFMTQDEIKQVLKIAQK